MSPPHPPTKTATAPLRTSLSPSTGASSIGHDRNLRFFLLARSHGRLRVGQDAKPDQVARAALWPRPDRARGCVVRLGGPSRSAVAGIGPPAEIHHRILQAGYDRRAGTLGLP